jgi:hypothetical protein
MQPVKSGYDIIEVMREVLEMAVLQIEHNTPETKDYVLSRLRELHDLPAKTVPVAGHVALPADLVVKLDVEVGRIRDLERDGFKCDDTDEVFFKELKSRLMQAEQPVDERGLFEESEQLPFTIEYDPASQQYKEIMPSSQNKALAELANARWKTWQARATLPRHHVPLTGDIRTFDEGIRRAHSVVKMAAANRSTPEVVRELEDLAIDILDYAPAYKSKWALITKLFMQLHEARDELDATKLQLQSMGWKPAP